MYHTKQTRVLKECCQQQDTLAVSREEALIRNVLVLGPNSGNGRRYTQEAIANGLPRYEGAKVNIDHAKPQEQQKLGQRFGKLVNLRLENGQPRADIRYNPKHHRAEEIVWWAENEDDCLGLSHNALCKGHTENGVFVVEEIVKVVSVDLVADPATTHGLRESMDPDMSTDTTSETAPSLPEPGTEGYESQIGQLVAAIVQDTGLSTSEKKKKILTALKLMDEGGSDSNADDDLPAEASESLRVLVGSKDPNVKRLLETVDRYRVRTRLASRREKAMQLCEESRLPAHLITDVFLQTLVEAKDDATMKRLVEDRGKAYSIKKPRSAPPGTGHHPAASMDTKTFARQLKG